jgi:DNA-binding CsgD family transcriptional regulator
MMGEMLGTFAELGSRPSDFIDLIGSVGDSTFAVNVLRLAHQLCGADHSSVFHWTSGQLATVASLAPASLDGSDFAKNLAGRYLEQHSLVRDPAYLESIHCPERKALFFHADMKARNVNFGGFYDEADVCDRIVLTQRVDSHIFGVSLLRTVDRGMFSESEIWRVGNVMDPLLALSRKHISLLDSWSDVAGALTSLSAIEECIRLGPIPFPRREAQVCARILYGITTAGIAGELGVAEETVSTYRKRIYERLSIATQRELMVWHLTNWSRWGRQCQNSYRLQ